VSHFWHVRPRFLKAAIEPYTVMLLLLSDYFQEISHADVFAGEYFCLSWNLTKSECVLVY
jgi:hypothetical protein